MKLISELGQPYTIYDVDDPVDIDRFWGYSQNLNDFVLHHLMYLEEINASVAMIRIGSEIITVPTNWNILTICRETSIIDTVEVMNVMGGSYTAFGFCPEKTKIFYLDFEVIDVKEIAVVTTPSMQRGMALCHYVGHNEYGSLSVLLTPYEILPKGVQVDANMLLY